jgi:hypothetical protein
MTKQEVEKIAQTNLKGVIYKVLDEHTILIPAFNAFHASVKSRIKLFLQQYSIGVAVDMPAEKVPAIAPKVEPKVEVKPTLPPLPPPVVEETPEPVEDEPVLEASEVVDEIKEEGDKPFWNKKKSKKHKQQ